MCVWLVGFVCVLCNFGGEGEDEGWGSLFLCVFCCGEIFRHSCFSFMQIVMEFLFSVLAICDFKPFESCQHVLLLEFCFYFYNCKKNGWTIR